MPLRLPAISQAIVQPVRPPLPKLNHRGLQATALSNWLDAGAVRCLIPHGQYDAIVSFELKDARREDVFRLMDRLKIVVRGTSLGDVHSLILYPVIASHRDIAPKQRERMPGTAVCGH